MALTDESRIQGYLQEWLSTLEQKPAFLKNSWKRWEEIQAQILDMQQRLAAVRRSNRREGRGPIIDHRYSSEWSSQRYSQRPIRKAGL